MINCEFCENKDFDQLTIRVNELDGEKIPEIYFCNGQCFTKWQEKLLEKIFQPITEESVRGSSYYQDWFVDEFIEEFDLGFRLGNAVKYMLRAGKKPGQDKIKDLTKAKTYINRHIARKNSKPNWLLCDHQSQKEHWIKESQEKFELSENIVMALKIMCGFYMGTLLESAIFEIQKEITK